MKYTKGTTRANEEENNTKTHYSLLKPLMKSHPKKIILIEI